MRHLYCNVMVLYDYQLTIFISPQTVFFLNSGYEYNHVTKQTAKWRKWNRTIEFMNLRTRFFEQQNHSCVSLFILPTLKFWLANQQKVAKIL